MYSLGCYFSLGGFLPHLLALQWPVEMVPATKGLTGYSQWHSQTYRCVESILDVQFLKDFWIRRSSDETVHCFTHAYIIHVSKWTEAYVLLAIWLKIQQLAIERWRSGYHSWYRERQYRDGDESSKPFLFLLESRSTRISIWTVNSLQDNFFQAWGYLCAFWFLDFCGFFGLLSVVSWSFVASCFFVFFVTCFFLSFFFSDHILQLLRKQRYDMI